MGFFFKRHIFGQNSSFKQSQVESSMFIFHSSVDMLVVLIYMHDILLTGTDSQLIANLIFTLHFQVSLKELGDPPFFFLGIEAYRIENSLHLSQAKYISDLLAKASMVHSNVLPTPMACDHTLSIHED